MDDPLPDAHRIADTCAMSDPIQRNLWITYIYHRLEVALARRLGGEDVSWCAYGTWASKSAGRFIRGELVLEVLRPLMARTAAVGRMVARVDAEVRERIARGNLLVFAELAPLFRALVDVLDRPRAQRREAAAVAFAGLTAGATAAGGQELLRRAFAAYVAAADTSAAKERAELILLANTLVGYHEQIRLQPTIAAALSAPLAVLVPRPGHFDPSSRRDPTGWQGARRAHIGQYVTDEQRSQRGGEQAREGRNAPVAAPVTADAAPLRRALGERLGDVARSLLTRWMMTIDLPEGPLALGRDVPMTRDGRMFPPPLMQIEHPELRAVLEEVDRTPDTTAGSAADDWAALADRMNFIVDLFRSRQRDASLRRAPFRLDQVAAMELGVRPLGPL
ncbi:hypothetical protein [Nannocystis radixulma]|uniref:Uncharacterized protein n=1 Tax=Nannocystis radixulma TaxID=2995305 RepID=A0ABT5BJR9_9BACT|nr:hypothetical protein [Nannocystis radixulma]MDC0674401.1 hypothetical protein [Nannocystis radixulma]